MTRSNDFFIHFFLLFIQWDLVCGYEYIPKLAVSAQFVGIMLGVAMFGFLSDRYGRRWPGLAGNACMLLVQTLTGLSPNVVTYIIMRILLGFCAGM